MVCAALAGLIDWAAVGTHGAAIPAVAREDVQVDLHRSEDQELFRETTTGSSSRAPARWSTVREWAEKEPDG